MGLHFAQEPLRSFRQGVPQGFRVVGAEWTTLEKDRAIRLELESDDPPDREVAAAAFSLWIDPRSMLIERIEGRQQLPDGSTQKLTLEIEPVEEAMGEEGDGR